MKKRPTIIMKPKYDILLRGTPERPAGLYQLQLLTAKQLTTLHYKPGTLKSVQKRLKALTTDGFVQFDFVPSRAMRKPYYYVLGQAGADYLATVGCDVGENWKPSTQIGQHYTFIEHTLSVNDIVISAFLLHRDVPAAHLCDFDQERQLKRHPFKATWKDDTGLHNVAVIPDAFLEFHIDFEGGYHRLPVLLEYDAGSEEQMFFRRRIRAYIILLKAMNAGTYQPSFNPTAVNIAFVTFAGERRVEQMRSWTKTELERTHEIPEVGKLFRFANLTRPLDPASVWLSPNWLSVDDKPPEVLLAA